MADMDHFVVIFCHFVVYSRQYICTSVAIAVAKKCSTKAILYELWPGVRTCVVVENLFNLIILFVRLITNR